MCIDGQFGIVCDDDQWDDKEADVLCRELGFSNSTSKKL